MNKKITRFDANTRDEYENLKAYDRIKESGRKPKVSRKGGNRRQPKWIEVVEEDIVDDPVVVAEEPEDWRFYSIEQDYDVEFKNNIKLPYAVDSEVLFIKGVPTHIIFAMIHGKKVVLDTLLDTLINDELAEEFANFHSHQPRHEQLRSARSYAETQWFDDDVLDIKAAGFKVL